MLSGKKLTRVSKSCVRWAYVWSTSENPAGQRGNSVSMLLNVSPSVLEFIKETSSTLITF